MTEGFKLSIAGPFTLRITFALTKDGREEAGNLLKEQEFTRKFDNVENAMKFLNSAFSAVPPLGDPHD